jgi:ribulose-phosphate 3-epimerase
MDMRSAPQANRVAACGDPALAVNSAGAGPVSAEWMIPKALWLKENEPEVYEAAQYVCEYQDFVNFHLTGRMCASVNNASVRWHFDASRPGGWPESMLRVLGMEGLLNKWPKEVLPPGVVVGGLISAAAQHLGLPEGLPVAQGGADAFIGMIGLGVVNPGDMALLTGSSHLHLGCTDKVFHGSGIWGTYNDAVLPDVNIVEGGQTSTGSVLAWFKRLVGNPSWEELNAEGEAVPLGCEGVVCLDHFQGNRTPHTDALSRGAITGLTLKHGRGHVFRALIESVCFGTEAVLTAMRANGYSPSQIVVAGGPTKSDLWLQCHADACGLPFVLTKVSDAPMLGCAILAAKAAGLYPDVRAAVQAMVHIDRIVQPDPARTQAYRMQFATYQQLYTALKKCNHYRSDVLPQVLSAGLSVERATADSSANASSALRAIISPSILSADFAALARDVIRVAQAGAEWIHVDIFDGNFVPNLTIGPPVVKSLRKHTNAFLDCHLCVLNPQNYVADLAAAGASQMTFHIETEGIDMSCERAAALAAQIRWKGMMAGIALAPETPAEAVFPLLEAASVDTVLLLSVRPGFGGQKFMPSVLPKVKALRTRFPSVNIEVDGGINLENASLVAAAGANALVAGTTVFAGPQPPEVMVPQLVGLIASGLKESGVNIENKAIAMA